MMNKVTHKGDWIVEENGKHYVLTDKEYERSRKDI